MLFNLVIYWPVSIVVHKYVSSIFVPFAFDSEYDTIYVPTVYRISNLIEDI